MKYAAILTLALAFCQSPLHAQTLLMDNDLSLYRQAFQALENKHGQEALQLASRAQDRTLYDVVVGLALAADDSTADFNAYENYLATHPTWPKSQRKPIAKMAEKTLAGANIEPARVIAFFAENPVQTEPGLKAYAAALYAAGQQQKGQAAIRDFWATQPMDLDAQQDFLANFQSLISNADINARIDEMLWQHRYEQAERLMDSISPDQQALVKARMALARMDDKAPRLLAKVPANLQNQPGLLYERMRWRRKKDDNDGALAMMLHAGKNLGHAAAWWDERNTLIRQLMAAGEYQNAYKLAAQHGMGSDKGSDYIEAEFLCGWLALRHLNNAPLAVQHFTKLYNGADVPASISRGAYWLARALEATGRGDSAKEWYAKAAQYNITYYGQLAAAQIYPGMDVTTPQLGYDPVQRQQFEADPMARLIAQLAQAGFRSVAADFAIIWANNMNNEQAFRLLCDLGLRLGAPDLAVKVAKIAAKKKILLPLEGFPILLAAQDAQSVALVHSIARQESQFDERAVSSSNAQGLMQLLPSTAKHVAGKNDMDPNNLDLFDPATNIKLGTIYINDLLQRFDGSLPLAIAGYNAGPGRVRQWLDKMGDPRGGQADMIDWIETIPYTETRIYVQRVMENLQIYRAKFSGGTAPLTIAADLRTP